MSESGGLHNLEQLSWYREKQELTIKDLAEISGISEHTIRAYEITGYASAQFEVVERVVRALGLKFIFIESDK